eukprot:TRINITY_DN3015_c0_g2_i1.p1 TRINITY_DN3015_c0_g2~~TRINITY_DN3015_c0_g2_i1.p1  ORF type:complete len:393 (+),score=102.00 TRINITY_DN3015_c0_g2_i1:362-1540(+)
MDKGLKQFLNKTIVQKEIEETLAVCDKKLGSAIKEQFPDLDVVCDPQILELFRCIRSQQNELLSSDLDPEDIKNMSLGLAHSLGRYKLKFSPDKVDMMIVQAIALLDDLDKELNTFSMRVKEWYGWHFPELGRILSDNITYARVVRHMGSRAHMNTVDLTDVLDEPTVKLVKEAGLLSMGTDISDEDMSHIVDLCVQVIEIAEYREELSGYIKNRMNAIAPNLTLLVGELVGARLIAHAGSLINLAKHPASTVQILGAEKALFRALKTKKATPKYGLIYHASLIGQTAPKNKGKISRILANKAALGCRVDALGDETTKKVSIENLQKIHSRIQELDGRAPVSSATGRAPERYEKKDFGTPYQSKDDLVLEKKRKRESSGGDRERKKARRESK